MRVFFKAFGMNLKVFLAYPRGLLISVIIFPIVMVLNIFLFTSIFSYNGTTHILGFDLTQMIWYYGVTMFVWVFTYNFADQRMSNYILSGELAVLLMRPMPLFRYEFASASALRTAAVICEFVPVMAIFSLLRPPTFLTWGSFGMFLVIIVLAFGLQFLLNFIVGLSAVLTQNNAGIARLVNAMLTVLGGAVIPLDYFPDALQRICAYLPFQYIFYEPVRFFIRHGDTSALAWGQAVLIQLGWIVGLYAVIRILWALLLKKIVVAGG